MRCVLAVAVLFIAAVQTTWAPTWQVGGVGPDLLLIVIISLGINLGWADGALAGFALGFLQGTMQGDGLGSYLVSRAMAGALAGYLRPAISQQNLFAPSLCVLSVGFAAESVFFLMAPRAFSEWLTSTVTLCVYCAALTPVLHLPVTAMLRRAQPPT